MAKRTRDADRLQTAINVEISFHTDDCVELQQRERRAGIVEVHAPVPQLRDQRLRQRVCIAFQSDRESRRGADTRTNAAEVRAFNRAMQLQRVAPKGLVAERVETKSLLALVEHALGVRVRLALTCRRLRRVCPTISCAYKNQCHRGGEK